MAEFRMVELIMEPWDWESWAEEMADLAAQGEAMLGVERMCQVLHAWADDRMRVYREEGR